MKVTKNIPSDFPYESRFININNQKIHYIDCGDQKKDPIIFLHGIPVHSYIWRNIISVLHKNARCIALDFVGMGKSDKPDIDYTFSLHTDYLTKFIKSLKLRDVTLVMHGFGGVVGFSYAMENERNVKALAFYEAYLRPMNEKSKLAVPAQQLFTSLLQNPEQSHKAVVQNNFLVKKILAHGLARPITAEELANYEAPLQSKEHREILWKNVQNFNKSTNSLVEEQAKYLKTTNKPKLLLYNVPGFVISMETIRWCQNNFPNLAVAELGEGYNFGQETDPKSFAKALQEWYKRIK